MLSLDHLPVELIDQIAGCLCHDCTPGHPQIRDAWGSEDDREKRQKVSTVVALAHLCRTSKKLSAIATPHLYHRPAEGKWWLLARTLIARPDLASHVRHLFDDSLWRHVFVLFNPEMMLDFPEEVLWGHFSGSEVIRAIKDNFKTKDFGREVGLSLHSWGKSDVLDMMVSLCANVREVAAEINSPEIFTRSIPGSLRDLRHVNFKHRESRERERMPLNLLGCIATVAPRVTTLTCETVKQNTENMMTMPTFARLVELRLEDAAIGLEPLRKFLVACPNLRSFSYRAGGQNSVFNDYVLEQFTPLEAQQAVVCHAPNLTSFALDMPNTHVNGPYWSFDMIRSLSELTKLERLTLDFNCLFPEIKESGGASGDDSDPMLMVRLLPSSIRSLSLSRTRQHPSKFERLHIPLMQLASATRDQFPKLETVTASGLGLEWRPQEGVEEVKAAFEAQGIIACFD
jgi:hypothetical protein